MLYFCLAKEDYETKIINYPDFLEAINTMFSQTSIYDVTSYNEEMTASKQKRKKKIANISTQLKRLKTDIEKYKAQIRLAQENDDKKKYGILLNQLLTTKMSLLRAYKEQKAFTPFSELSTEAKTFACTQRLMKKYLLPAFAQSSPRAVILNEDGTVSLNIDDFLNSILYQQAQHIKDYVASYIEKYPTRVNGSRYFTGLHHEAENFDDLIYIADSYFEKINDENNKNLDSIIKSHQGLEVIEIYPEHHVQAVRLLTKEALEYEGSQLNHCVATYASRVEKGATQIYSIRDYGDNATEFAPHATIEFENGKIKQIKGYRDSIVDWQYIEDTRRFLMSLMRTDDFVTIMRSTEIPASEKLNIGIVADTSGKTHDILHPTSTLEDIFFDKIRIKSDRIKSLKNIGIKFKTLEVDGPLYPKTIENIANLPKIDNLILHSNCYTSTLDLSAISCHTLELDIQKDNDIQKIVFPQNLKEIKIKGNFPKLSSFINSEDLQSLSLSGEFPRLTEEAFPSSLQNFNLSGNSFESIEKLDLSSFTRLTQLDMMNSTFLKLREIVLSDTVRNFNASHCRFPALENVDISRMPFKSFNTLEKNGETSFPFNHIPTSYKIHMPILRGYLMNFSSSPCIKNIQLCKDIESISFSGMTFGESASFNFSEYKNLKKIDFQFSSFDPNCIINLSQNDHIQELRCDTDLLSQIIPPAQTPLLSLSQRDGAPLLQSWPLETFPLLKELHTNFLPHDMNISCPVDTLHLCLLSPDKYPSDLKVFDFSAYKCVNLKTSSNVQFSELERLVMPEKFSEFLLFHVSPKLTEIDFSQTKGKVELKDIDYSDEVFNGEGQIYLHPQQFEVLKKIKLGKSTELVLPQRIEHLPLTIELSADTPPEKRQRLKEQYPNLLIVRAANIQTELQLLKSAKQADGRR